MFVSMIKSQAILKNLSIEVKIINKKRDKNSRFSWIDFKENSSDSKKKHWKQNSNKKIKSFI